MDNKCVVEGCGKSFQTERSLHAHIKAHGLLMAEYYEQYYPRYDKFDNNKIIFKDKEQYFNTDFNSHKNYVAWLKNVPNEESKDYFLKRLKKRKEEKNLTWSLTQVELRSLNLCGIKYVNEHYGDYFKLCESLGFKNRFCKYLFNKPLIDISNETILIDTREQHPLKFPLHTENIALSFGDYALKSSQKVKSNVYIERKDVGDFHGTLSGTNNFARFKREIQRAKENKAYLIILVESSFKIAKEYCIGQQAFTKIPPVLIWRNVREILQERDFVQFLFVDDRDEASRVIQKIFASNSQYSETDLQLLYDTGKL